MLIHTLTYHDAEIDYIQRSAGVLVTEVSAKGSLGRQHFFAYTEEADDVSRSALGFLRTAKGIFRFLRRVFVDGDNVKN